VQTKKLYVATILIGDEKALRMSPFIRSIFFRLIHIASLTMLESQNQQLKEAIQKLFVYTQNGNCLPVLSVHITDNGRPSVDDIVAYVNTLPQEALVVNHPSSQPLWRSDVAHNGFSEWAQAEPGASSSPYVPETMDPSMRVQTPYLENSIDLDNLWSLIDVNAPDAAALYNFLQSRSS
jgi:hypothetical protein